VRLIAPLGQGGLCETWHAIDEQGQDLAIKRLLPHLRARPEHDRILAREAAIMACVAHPRIPRLAWLGEHDGIPSLAYALAPGRDLAMLLGTSDDPRLPPAHVVTMALDVADALDAVHAACDATGQPLGLVHRDVCPANVVVTPDGHAMLIDLGIATTRAGASLPGPATGLQVHGRPAYQAPEEVAGGAVDGRADQFSLAVIVWELLAGRRLFGARAHPAATLHAVVHEAAPPLPGSWPDGVDRVLQRALGKAPGQRYATAGELARELARCLTGR
jgi:serine/threonine protein kinase